MALRYGADGHFSGPTMFTGPTRTWAARPRRRRARRSIRSCRAPSPSRSTCPCRCSRSRRRVSRRSYRADGSLNTGETDPERLFTTLFASQALPSAQLAALKARARAVPTTSTSCRRTARARHRRSRNIATHLESIRRRAVDDGDAHGRVVRRRRSGIAHGVPSHGAGVLIRRRGVALRRHARRQHHVGRRGRQHAVRHAVPEPGRQRHGDRRGARHRAPRPQRLRAQVEDRRLVHEPARVPRAGARRHARGHGHGARQQPSSSWATRRPRARPTAWTTSRSSSWAARAARLRTGRTVRLGSWAGQTSTASRAAARAP